MSLDEVKVGINEFSDIIIQYVEQGKTEKNVKFFMDIYSQIIRMCDERDMGSDMFKVYKDLMISFIMDKSVPACENMANNNRDFIREYAIQWRKFSFYFFSMKRMFDYLDRFYL